MSHPWNITQAMKIPFDMFISIFVRKHTKFGIKIFVIEVKWYLSFDPSEGPEGTGPNCAVARPIPVSNSHTKFGWISSKCLGGDSITDKQAEFDFYTQAPLKSQP